MTYKFIISFHCIIQILNIGYQYLISQYLEVRIWLLIIKNKTNANNLIGIQTLIMFSICIVFNQKNIQVGSYIVPNKIKK